MNNIFKNINCPKCKRLIPKVDNKVIILNDSDGGYFVRYGIRCVYKDCDGKFSTGAEWLPCYPTEFLHDEEIIYGG